MKREILLKLLTGSLLLGCLTLAAQDKGAWRATSNTARSITGDVSLSEEKFSISFIGFPMAHIRGLTQPEVSSVFDADSAAAGSGNLYRLNIPASRKFLNKNSLCGGEDVQWMVSYASGKALQLAFFSGQKVPVFTFDAISKSTDLCGTFSYAK